MKKVLALLCLLSLGILLLAGCEAKVCRYVNEKGNDYLILNREKVIDFNPSKNGLESVPFIRADSMGELIKKVKKTAFTDYEVYTISRMWTDEKDRVILPDLDNILEVVLPDDLSWTRAAFYDGGKYVYRNASTSMRAEVGSFESPHTKNIETATNSAVITENATPEEINEIRYTQYKQSTNPKTGYGMKIYYFRVEKGDQVFYVTEKYDLFWENGWVQEDLPDETEIFIKIDTDLWVCVTVGAYDKALPIDWITSIEVRPFRGK